MKDSCVDLSMCYCVIAECHRGKKSNVVIIQTKVPGMEKEIKANTRRKYYLQYTIQSKSRGNYK